MRLGFGFWVAAGTIDGSAAAAAAAGGVAAGVAGSPCGACKFLRRRCVAECVFAPYFSSDQGAARFAAIHKVFGASNAAKLLAHLPLADRCEAVVTITYEAQSRLRDPVYGCVAQIFALQQQVRRLVPFFFFFFFFFFHLLPCRSLLRLRSTNHLAAMDAS
nr:LOB domain-containing protein 16-like [Aegilops tauschii subsp. strangulata]